MAEESSGAGTTTTTDAPSTAATAAAETSTPAPAAASTSTQQDTASAKTDPRPGEESGKDTALTGDQTKSTAPEKYEFKAPEGVKLDSEVIGAFSDVAKELGLSQDAAQKVVDKLGPKVAERNAAAIESAITETRTKWQDASRSDKEFGGEKLDANLAVAKKALDAYGSPALRELLNTTGLGDNPEIIRAFYRAGKALSEDTTVPGGARPGEQGKSVSERLYS